MICFIPLLSLLIYGLSCADNTISKAERALEEHDLAEAERLFREVIAQDSKNEQALAGLGWTYHLALEKDNAVNNFSQCLSVNPENIECMRGRASVILAQGDALLAETWINRAEQLDPGNPEVQVTKSLWLLSTGKISDARVLLEQVVSKHPQESKYWVPYVESLLREGQTKKAKEKAELALQISPSPRRTVAMLWMVRARILLEGSAQNGQDCTQAINSGLWIDEAKRSIDEAKKTGVEIPNLAMVEEQMQRRRLDLRSKCPEILP